MEQCTYCQRIFEPRAFEEFRSNVLSDAFTLPVYDADQVYSLVHLSGIETCICETCYRNRHWEMLSPAELTELHFQMGLELSQQHRHADAAECYRKALDVERTSEILGSLAIAMENMEQIAEAIPLLEEVKRRDPDHAIVVRSLARLYNAVGRYQLAILETERTSSSRHFVFHGFLDRAEALLALGRDADARGAAQQAHQRAAECCTDCADECRSRWSELYRRVRP